MIDLPAPVAAYFQSSAEDDEAALAKFFDENAVVLDEGKEHFGIDAIRIWRQEVMARTPFTAEPLSIVKNQEGIVVPTEVTGTFPGSPLTLNHRFGLKNDLITKLEIN